MNQLLAYLQLFRLPNVFTAMSNVCMGFLIAHGSLAPWREFLPLLVASASIYLAGIALNDWFDVEVDRQERPGRPLPSGRIPVAHALAAAIALMAVGLIAAAFASRNSLLVAGLLVGSVWLYDGWAKNTLFGAMVMGLCRGLNVVLGMSSMPDAIWLMDQELPTAWRFGTMVAAGVGLYIMGVTRFARRETATPSRPETTSSAMGFNFGLLLIAFAAYTAFRHPIMAEPTDPYWLRAARDPAALSPEIRFYTAIALWGLVLLVTNAMVWRAVAIGEPAAVQQAVKTCIVALIVIDAAVISLVNGPVYAAIVLTLLVPTLTLGRWVYST